MTRICKFYRILISILLFLLWMTLPCSTTRAQLTGLWEVKTITAGKMVRTPDARWYRFEEDNTFLSGNGWKQHEKGRYQYLNDQRQLEITSGQNSTTYAVMLNDSLMHWTRAVGENNMKITLIKKSGLPQSTSDKVQGVWRVQNKEGQSLITSMQQDSTGTPMLFIRWDGRFVLNKNNTVVKSGYWYADPHYPDIELISENGHLSKSKWRVTFQENGMKWLGASGQSNEHESLTLERANPSSGQ